MDGTAGVASGTHVGPYYSPSGHFGPMAPPMHYYGNTGGYFPGANPNYSAYPSTTMCVLFVAFTGCLL
jgi:hypothetical protein